MTLIYQTGFTGTIVATRDTAEDRPRLWTVYNQRDDVRAWLTDEQFASVMAFAIAAVELKQLPDYDEIKSIPNVTELELLP
jgi:hypothetical protein